MASTLPAPPRFVPTLTTVIELESARTEIAAPDAVVPAVSGEPTLRRGQQLSKAVVLEFDDQLVQRVLQRVERSLEAGFSDTVTAAVQQQFDAMLPRLRVQIETLLRASVVEALAHEFSENTGSTPTSTPESLG